MGVLPKRKGLRSRASLEKILAARAKRNDARVLLHCINNRKMALKLAKHARNSDIFYAIIYVGNMKLEGETEQLFRRVFSGKGSQSDRNRVSRAIQKHRETRMREAVPEIAKRLFPNAKKERVKFSEIEKE